VKRPMMAMRIVGDDIRHVAKIVALVHDGEPRLRAAIACLRRFGADLAVRRRRSRELPALRQHHVLIAVTQSPRCGGNASEPRDQATGCDARHRSRRGSDTRDGYLLRALSQ
jgi:hypothetical protein